MRTIASHVAAALAIVLGLTGCDQFAYQLTPTTSVPCDPGSSCNLVGQCGCAVDQACDVHAPEAPACRVEGTGTQGSDCTSDTDCAAGFGCRGGTGKFQCRRWCLTSSDCDGPGASCGIPVAGVTAQLCSTDCDPIDASRCPSDMGCYLFAGDGTPSVTDCRAPGTVGLGGICGVGTDCAPGFACLSDSTCARLCSDRHPDCSALPGTQCALFDPRVRIGSATFGVCVPG